MTVIEAGAAVANEARATSNVGLCGVFLIGWDQR
jgi:hypothetical protein